MRLVTLLLLISFACLSQMHPSSVDWVWYKIKNGAYKIDMKNDDGGVYMPVITDKKKVIYILRDYSKMIHVPNFGILTSESCSKCSDAKLKTYPQILTEENICNMLKHDPMKYKASILRLCLKQIKNKIAKNNYPLTQEKTIKNLYKLPKYQQDFAAAIFTGYGEGRGESNKELALIFKTIANRIEYAKDEGCKKVNALDIALQRFQFSMWNKNDPNWSKAVSVKNEESSEIKQQDRIINVFINFKNNKYKFTPKEIANKIYHYRTKSMPTAPSWGETTDAEKIVKVNGSNLGASNTKAGNAHYFFKSVPWSFKYHPLRSKAKGEDECY